MDMEKEIKKESLKDRFVAVWLSWPQIVSSDSMDAL